jgi:hypothetical protein
LQASAYANGSVGLAALGVDASVFITDWRVAMTPSADATYWTCSSPFVIEQFGSPALGSDVVYTGNATTVTAVASASAGAATRCTSTAHGLTSANNGVSVYVSAGTNWIAGLYPMTYVDANNYDLAVAWNAGFGNPTVRSVTGTLLQTLLKSVSIPAKLMQANSKIDVESSWQMSATANNRYMTIKHSGDDLFQLSTSNQGAYQDTRWIRNRGLKTAQIGPAIGAGGLFIGQTPRIASINTDAATTIDFYADIRTVNEFMRIAGYTVKVTV